VSQLQEGIPAEPPEAANSTGGHAAEQVGSRPQERSRQNASEHPSDHTRVWSELSGTATKSVNGTEDRPQAQGQPDLDIHRIRNMEISKGGPVGDTAPAAPPKSQRPTQIDHAEGSRGTCKIISTALSSLVSLLILKSSHFFVTCPQYGYRTKVSPSTILVIGWMQMRKKKMTTKVSRRHHLTMKIINTSPFLLNFLSSHPA
jgi:hypothetical protein